MAIKSSTFGGTKLSGEDAERFERHIREDRRNPLARKSLARGRELFSDDKLYAMTNKVILAMHKDTLIALSKV